MASLARTARTARTVAAAVSAPPTFRVREKHGVVIKSGFMDKTVTVTCANKEWNSLLKKYFDRPVQHLVHDPNNSLRTGDVVAIVAGWRVSKTVRHVVQHIIKPAGVPIEERPMIPTPEERVAKRDAAKAAKDERRKFARDVEAMVEAMDAKVRRAVASSQLLVREGRRAATAEVVRKRAEVARKMAQEKKLAG